MPIKNKTLYPPNWKEISSLVRAKAKGQCQCMGECGLHRTHPGPRRCEEMHGQLAKWAKGKIVLTVAHLDHNPRNNAWENLKALCQRCHLRIDLGQHMKNAAETRRLKKEFEQRNQIDLPI